MERKKAKTRLIIESIIAAVFLFIGGYALCTFLYERPYGLLQLLVVAVFLIFLIRVMMYKDLEVFFPKSFFVPFLLMAVVLLSGIIYGVSHRVQRIWLPVSAEWTCQEEHDEYADVVTTGNQAIVVAKRPGQEELLFECPTHDVHCVYTANTDVHRFGRISVRYINHHENQT